MTALIEPRELYEGIQSANPDLKIIDATYPAMLATGKPAIPGAIPFDIDEICDHGNPLPHMLPRAENFAASVSAMGISNSDEIVVYDDSGLAFAAARVWWIFRAFGHERVRVLNGGLPLWMASGFAVSGQPAPAAKQVSYIARLRPELVKSAEQLSNNLGDKEILILDARPEGRFTGAAAEPRPGMRSGHIPGSVNLPFERILEPGTGRLLKDSPELNEIIEKNPTQIITSCGSGVTACVLALGLFEAERIDAAVFDGSWSEWGNEASKRPVETGPGHKFRIERP